MMVRSAALICLATALASGRIDAQPTPRPLGPVLASTALSSYLIPSLRELSNGTILAIDSVRRLVLLDTTFRLLRVVNDSLPASRPGTIPRPGFLLTYRGDSTAYHDGVAQFLRVVTPDGTIGRTPIPLRSRDMFAFRRENGTPAIDPRGRLIIPEFQQIADSNPVLALDLLTRTIDTLAMVAKQPRTQQSRVRPLPIIDDWVVLDDGTLIVLRSGSFTIERYAPNGRMDVGGPVPHVRLGLTPADKAHIVDSLTATAAETQKALAGVYTVLTSTLPPETLPDALPPYMPNTTIAGPGRTVWVTENRRYRTGEPWIVDVIDAASQLGVIRERVIIPAGATIIAFGQGVLYLKHPTGLVQRVRLR